jgi:hypothetical protein
MGAYLLRTLGGVVTNRAMLRAGCAEKACTRTLAEIFAGFGIDDDNREVLPAGVCDQIIPALGNFGEVSGLQFTGLRVFVSRKCPLATCPAAMTGSVMALQWTHLSLGVCRQPQPSASRWGGPEHAVLRHAARPCGARTRKCSRWGTRGDSCDWRRPAAVIRRSSIVASRCAFSVSPHSLRVSSSIDCRSFS